MKKLLLISMLLFSVPLIADEWRTPHSSKDISRFLENGSDFEGNFVGVTGKVVKTATGYQGKPLFLISVSDEFGSKTIAVGSLLDAQLSVGDVLEILGDVIPIQEDDTKISKITNEKVMVLGLCIVNKTKGYASGAESALALCNKWYLESFPRSYKDV